MECCSWCILAICLSWPSSAPDGNNWKLDIDCFFTNAWWYLYVGPCWINEPVSGSGWSVEYLNNLASVTLIIGFSCSNLIVKKVIRHGKSCKHESIAFGQFLRKLWTFWKKKKFCRPFLPINAQKFAVPSSIDPFMWEIIPCIEKNFHLGYFYILGNHCGHFVPW